MLNSLRGQGSSMYQGVKNMVFESDAIFEILKGLFGQNVKFAQGPGFVLVSRRKNMVFESDAM